MVVMTVLKSVILLDDDDDDDEKRDSGVQDVLVPMMRFGRPT